MRSLYVTVRNEIGRDYMTVGRQIFPGGCQWKATDLSGEPDGSAVIRFEWDGTLQGNIERRLANHLDVIGYQIL